MKITKDTSLEEVKKLGEECDKCGKCCSYGSGFMLESEVPRMAAFLKIPKEKFIRDFLEETEIFHTRIFKIRPFKKEGMPYGPCMFLDKNLCRIHAVKPLHCNVCNCAEHGDDLHVWFMVNYCLNIYDPESIRQYASYLETGGRLIPGAELDKVFPDKAKLKRILDYDIVK
ncbi:YkgJ family cysteine cluster protein [Candidatus Woesearchaeota archaeon]|nr:YkgJ family cysteine cluster protein [Candidatus Woesearchaeota archaeon]